MSWPFVLVVGVLAVPAGLLGAAAVAAWSQRLPLTTGPPPSVRTRVITTVSVVVAGVAIAVSVGPGWATVADLVLAWGLVVGSIIDLSHRILPNRLTYKLPLLVLPALVVDALVESTGHDLRRALIVAVALPVGLFAFSELFRLLRGQEGIGLGDVKLSVSLGLVLGYRGGWELFVFGYATVAAAVVVAVVLLVLGRVRLASRIPFGPYLALGAMVVLIWGDPLVAWVTARVIG